MYAQKVAPGTPSSPQVAERRQSQRQNIPGTAEVFTRGFPPIKGTIANISLGGCFVCFQHPLPLNSAVMLTLDLGATKVELPGIVRRQEMGRGMGIEFQPALD